MTTFFLYSVLLLVLAFLFVIVPVIRYRPVTRTADDEIRKQKNTEVFKQGLADLERDREEGNLAQEDFARLKTELQRSFLRDMEDEEKRQRAASFKGNKLVPVLSLLFVALFSYFLYDAVGAARDLALPDILAELSTVETAEAQVAVLEELAAFLQDRFERNNEDIQNGYMLGTLYLELKQYQAAIDTFKALADNMESGMDKATVLGQLAQSMFLESDSQMTPAIQNVVDAALAMNPNEYAVMSLLAMEALLNEDIERAVSYWRRQLLQLNSGSREAAVLRERIARVEELMPSVAAAPAESAVDTVASVTVVIDVDDSVKGLVDDSMRLFVYARSPEFPMPLAVLTPLTAEFPMTITLSDENAMTPAAKLSSVEQVYVGARLSRSGIANPQAGDIQAESETFTLSDQKEPVRLSISEIVE